MSAGFGTFDADAAQIKHDAGNEPDAESESKPDPTQEASDSTQDAAGGIGGQASATVDAGMEKAAGGLDALASTLREKTGAMSEGTAQTVATTAADKLSSGAELLRAKDTDQLVADLEAFVRRKPVESLLIAFGVGFFLSKTL